MKKLIKKTVLSLFTASTLISVTPVFAYDNILPNVIQIKDFINQGLYLEAMQECRNAKAWHNLSPADIVIIDNLNNTANTGYNNYLNTINKPNYTPAYTSTSNYPNTIIPTYTSITGVSLLKQDTLSGGGPLYMYKITSADDIEKYFNILRNKGWSLYKSEMNTSKNARQTAWIHGNDILIFNIYYDISQIWITF